MNAKLKLFFKHVSLEWMLVKCIIPSSRPCARLEISHDLKELIIFAMNVKKKWNYKDTLSNLLCDLVDIGLNLFGSFLCLGKRCYIICFNIDFLLEIDEKIDHRGSMSEYWKWQLHHNTPNEARTSVSICINIFLYVHTRGVLWSHIGPTLESAFL